MKGKIIITKTEINGNKTNWSVIYLFRRKLRKKTKERSAGWYARILKKGIHTFLWRDRNSPRPTNKELDALKKDGYTVIETRTT